MYQRARSDRPGVAGLVVEERLAALPERLVRVHARAVVLEDRLGHEGEALAGLPGHVLEHVLERHQLVGHRQQRVEADADLALPAGGHLVVVQLRLDADLVERRGHVGAQVHVVVHGRGREVALLGPRLVAEVGPLVGARVPLALDRVDPVHRTVGLRLEPHVVEDEELRLRPEVRRVGDPAGEEVLLRLLGDEPGVAAVALAGDGVGDVAVHDERLPAPERVEVGGGGVGHQHHVALLDLLEAADRRAVERVPVLELPLVEHRGRDRHVLHHAGQVAEPEVDELHALSATSSITSWGDRSSMARDGSRGLRGAAAPAVAPGQPSDP